MTDKVQSFISSALVFGALALSVVTSPVRAMAQNIPLADAQIPFSFHVGSTIMPAGSYTFSRQMASPVIKLRDHATGNRIFAVAIADNKNRPQKDSAIVFARFGSEYFLRRVDDPNSSQTYKFLDDKQEKAVSRLMQTKNATQVAVTAEPILSK